MRLDRAEKRRLAFVVLVPVVGLIALSELCERTSGIDLVTAMAASLCHHASGYVDWQAGECVTPVTCREGGGVWQRERGRCLR